MTREELEITVARIDERTQTTAKDVLEIKDSLKDVTTAAKEKDAQDKAMDDAQWNHIRKLENKQIAAEAGIKARDKIFGAIVVVIGLIEAFLRLTSGGK